MSAKRSLFVILGCVVAAACGQVESGPTDAPTPIDAAVDANVDANVDAAIDATPAFTLTVTLGGGGTGTVTSTPAGINCGADCSEDYPQGTAVTLTAAAGPGSTFVGWTGGGCTGSGACTITVSAATQVAATFALNNSLVVTRTGTGGGTVTSNPGGISCGADCSEAFAPGTVVTLTATPDATSTFAGWSGGGCTGTGTCVVTTDSTIGVVASFNQVVRTLTVTRAGNGSGTVTSTPAGINCGADCTEDYLTGTVVTLAASPAAGSTFTGWSGGGCTGTGTCVVTLAAAATVTATFTLTQHTLVVQKAGTGTGTVTSIPAGINCGADCTEVYNYGTTVTLTANFTGLSTFAGWSGGGCTGTGTCVTTITAATTVTATFNAAATFTLTATKVGNGGGTVTSSPAGISCGLDCSEPYTSGTVVTLTATPALGSRFAGWLGGGCSGTGTCVVNVMAATTVTAIFDLANCDTFSYADSTTVPNWMENAGDWFIEGGRLRNAVPNGIYNHNITMNGSSQLNGCGRLTAIHTGNPSIQVVGVVLRWQPPASFIIALVQDNSNTGNFNSAWIYQNPGTMSIGGALTNQNFGLTPNVEACVSGTAVTLRIDAAQDGTYETSLTGTTTITTAGLTGVMAASQTTDVNSMPRIDNFCWGP